MKSLRPNYLEQILPNLLRENSRQCKKLVLEMSAVIEKLEQQQAELLVVKQQLSEKVNGT